MLVSFGYRQTGRDEEDWLIPISIDNTSIRTWDSECTHWHASRGRSVA